MNKEKLIAQALNTEKGKQMLYEAMQPALRFGFNKIIRTICGTDELFNKFKEHYENPFGEIYDKDKKQEMEKLWNQLDKDK